MQQRAEQNARGASTAECAHVAQHQRGDEGLCGLDKARTNMRSPRRKAGRASRAAGWPAYRPGGVGRSKDTAARGCQGWRARVRGSWRTTRLGPMLSQHGASKLWPAPFAPISPGRSRSSSAAARGEPSSSVGATSTAGRKGPTAERRWWTGTRLVWASRWQWRRGAVQMRLPKCTQTFFLVFSFRFSFFRARQGESLEEQACEEQGFAGPPRRAHARPAGNRGGQAPPRWGGR